MNFFITCVTTLLFSLNASGVTNKIASFPKDFFFGVANAPAQVEDNLDDAWLEWAINGNVRAFYNYDKPEKRINFWTDPEREIIEAKKLGVTVFRLGIDWGRLFPTKQTQIPKAEVIENYRRIFKLIKKHNMKVMLSLFHHAEPKWTVKYGSWANKEMINDFQF